MKKNLLICLVAWTCLLQPAQAEASDALSEPFFLTDKTEYSVGEVIGITIRFPFRGPVYFVDSGINPLPSSLGLETLDADDIWQPIFENQAIYQPARLTVEDQFWRYGVEGTYPNWSFEWDQIVSFEQQLSIVPGVYRFRFVYYSLLKEDAANFKQGQKVSAAKLEKLSKTVIASDPFVVNG